MTPVQKKNENKIGILTATLMQRDNLEFKEAEKKAKKLIKKIKDNAKKEKER